MEDRCPKCGSPLSTRIIKKELGFESIDYPVAQICPECNWNRDLTGAGDIETKKIPYAVPEANTKPGLFDFNKFLTIALALLVLGGIVLAYYPASPGQTDTAVPSTSVINETPVVAETTGIPASEIPVITPTGKAVAIKIDRYRGFFSQSALKISPGDEVVWTNEGTDPITLVSSDGLFEAKLLDNYKRTNYTFLKTGTYSFYLKENNNMTETITVEP